MISDTLTSSHDPSELRSQRRFATYHENRESQIHWIGVIPAHWAVKTLNRDGPILRGSSPRPIDAPEYFDDEGEYAWVRIEDVTASPDGYLRKTKQRLSPLGASHSRKLQPGDLFLSMAATVGRPCITAIKCCIHDGFVYFPYLRLKTRYAFFVFLSGELFRGEGKLGTQLNLNTQIIGSLRIPVPPLEEQQTIAAFLDRETARIDALIAKKQRLIELLREKRTALISHAVTKGLDPNAPMKSSGIDWLGVIPTPWSASPLKYLLSKIGSGKTPKGGAEVYVQEGVMLIRSQNVYDEGLRLDDVVCIDEETDSEMAGTRVRAADVLLNITGASIGRCSIVPTSAPPANVNQHVCILRPFNNRLHSSFLHAVLCSKGTKDWIRSQENGTSREGLNFRQIGNLVIALPSPEEQLTIVAYLYEHTGKLDSLVVQVSMAIDRLREYRSALISAAVTGKIDVRGEVS